MTDSRVPRLRSAMVTPRWPLPEIRLPAPASVPPTVLLDAPNTVTPSTLLLSAKPPETSVPM